MAKTKIAPVKDIGVEIMQEDGKDNLPALALEPYIDPKDKSFALRGNFDKVKAALEARRAEIAKMKLTAKDLDTVMKYKKEAQGYRTMIAALEKDYKSRYFNAPKDVFAGTIAGLQAIVADIEARADKVLDAEEEKRVKALTQVLDIYKDDLQVRYQLSEGGLATIEYKSTYFNKTAKEAVTKADLEEQFKQTKQRETARASGERMIRSLCKDNPLLDVDRYVKLLDDDELANIVDMIEAEKKRLAEAKNAVPAEVTAEVIEDDEPGSEIDGSASSSAPQALVLGVKGTMTDMLSGGSDFPGKTKTMTLEVTYPIDFGPALTEIFKELSAYGIKTKVKVATF